jgi:hypothetical protein
MTRKQLPGVCILDEWIPYLVQMSFLMKNSFFEHYIPGAMEGIDLPFAVMPNANFAIY